MKSEIILEYREHGKEYTGQIPRDKFFEQMKKLEKEHPYNNRFSKALVKLIPEMVCMTIDNDFNETQDVPIVQYQQNEGKTEVLKIYRTHRIIWSILHQYCDSAKSN